MAKKYEVKDSSGRVVGYVSRAQKKRNAEIIQKARNTSKSNRDRRAREQAQADLKAGLPANIEGKTIQITEKPPLSNEQIIQQNETLLAETQEKLLASKSQTEQAELTAQYNAIAQQSNRAIEEENQNIQKAGVVVQFANLYPKDKAAEIVEQSGVKKYITIEEKPSPPAEPPAIPPPQNNIINQNKDLSTLNTYRASPETLSPFKNNVADFKDKFKQAFSFKQDSQNRDIETYSFSEKAGYSLGLISGVATLGVGTWEFAGAKVGAVVSKSPALTSVSTKTAQFLTKPVPKVITSGAEKLFFIGAGSSIITAPDSSEAARRGLGATRVVSGFKGFSQGFSTKVVENLNNPNFQQKEYSIIESTPRVLKRAALMSGSVVIGGTIGGTPAKVRAGRTSKAQIRKQTLGTYYNPNQYKKYNKALGQPPKQQPIPQGGKIVLKLGNYGGSGGEIIYQQEVVIAKQPIAKQRFRTSQAVERGGSRRALQEVEKSGLVAYPKSKYSKPSGSTQPGSPKFVDSTAPGGQIQLQTTQQTQKSQTFYNANKNPSRKTPEKFYNARETQPAANKVDKDLRPETLYPDLQKNPVVETTPGFRNPKIKEELLSRVREKYELRRLEQEKQAGATISQAPFKVVDTPQIGTIQKAPIVVEYPSTILYPSTFSLNEQNRLNSGTSQAQPQIITSAQSQAQPQDSAFKVNSAIRQGIDYKPINRVDSVNYQPSPPNPVPEPFPEPSPQPITPIQPFKPITPRTPQRKNPPSPKPEPPLTPRRRGFDDISPQRGFNVLVRRGGVFSKVSEQPLTRGEALKLGSFVVGTTSAATFKLEATKTNKLGKYFGSSGVLSDFYKKGELFIEKRGRRIKSQGEKEEITFKGLRLRRGFL